MCGGAGPKGISHPFVLHGPSTALGGVCSQLCPFPLTEVPRVWIEYSQAPVGQGEAVNLTCHFRGEPWPMVQWEVPDVGASYHIEGQASSGQLCVCVGQLSTHLHMGRDTAHL